MSVNLPNWIFCSGEVPTFISCLKLANFQTSSTVWSLGQSLARGRHFFRELRESIISHFKMLFTLTLVRNKMQQWIHDWGWNLQFEPWYFYTGLCFFLVLHVYVVSGTAAVSDWSLYNVFAIEGRVMCLLDSELLAATSEAREKKCLTRHSNSLIALSWGTDVKSYHRIRTLLLCHQWLLLQHCVQSCTWGCVMYANAKKSFVDWNRQGKCLIVTSLSWSYWYLTRNSLLHEIINSLSYKENKMNWLCNLSYQGDREKKSLTSPVM